MKILLIILSLLLFSCTKPTHTIEIMPEPAEPEPTESELIESPVSEDSVGFIEDALPIIEENIVPEDVEIDSNAQLSIISQIPFDCFNLYDSSSSVELKYGDKSPANTISLEVPQDFFFNSIQAANEISDFAKTNPASIRGMFGNLMGIREVVKGTQKVLFGIIPKNTKVMDFRYEAQLVNPSEQILEPLVWKFNRKFNVVLSESEISMVRRADGLSMIRKITLENVGTRDIIKMLGENKELSAMIFKNGDLKLVRSDLQDFKTMRFDNFTVSVFLNPSLDDEAKQTITALLQSVDYAKELDYSLTVSANDANRGFQELNRDSIVIIYDRNNLIEFETAMLVQQFLQIQTGKKVIANADFEQRKLFDWDYDLVISANSAGLDKMFLSRKYSDLQINLFDMNIYLVSMQKIIAQSGVVSNLEVAK